MCASSLQTKYDQLKSTLNIVTCRGFNQIPDDLRKCIFQKCGYFDILQQWYIQAIKRDFRLNVLRVHMFLICIIFNTCLLHLIIVNTMSCSFICRQGLLAEYAAS